MSSTRELPRARVADKVQSDCGLAFPGHGACDENGFRPRCPIAHVKEGRTDISKGLEELKPLPLEEFDPHLALRPLERNRGDLSQDFHRQEVGQLGQGGEAIIQDSQKVQARETQRERGDSSDEHVYHHSRDRLGHGGRFEDTYIFLIHRLADIHRLDDTEQAVVSRLEPLQARRILS